jgi:hypothetical protein
MNDILAYIRGTHAACLSTMRRSLIVAQTSAPKRLQSFVTHLILSLELAIKEDQQCPVARTLEISGTAYYYRSSLHSPEEMLVNVTEYDLMVARSVRAFFSL